MICTAKFASKEGSSAFLFESIFLACLKRAIWTPKILSETLFLWRYVWNNVAPFHNISQKCNFFTDQDMIEEIAQNCAKTKGPTQKIDKIHFEVHRSRRVFQLLTLIEVLRKCPQFGDQDRFFFNFQKNEKWRILNWKISVTKFWKFKIWDDSFLAFPVAFVVVYSVFSVCAVFTEKFADQNRQF